MGRAAHRVFAQAVEAIEQREGVERVAARGGELRL